MKVSVVGLGYVGLPLVISFVRQGVITFGVDLDRTKIDLLTKGKSYIRDIEEKDIQKFINQQLFIPSDNYQIVKDSDVIIICVPTPLRKSKEPDISYVVSAVREIKRYLKKGQLVILESTVYPGATREIVLPILESSGLKVEEDFFLAYSPERVDPGNKKFHIRNTPKIVGGIGRKSLRRAVEVYKLICNEVIPVSSVEVAEMVKLLENSFRAVNIGLINEIAKLCYKMKIDVWEVIDAAKTKPYGFMPFYPGPGIGGHCIPVDPMYLSWRAKLYNFTTRFIDLADEVNRSMQKFVVERIADILNQFQKPVNGSKILILGVSYKRDIGDTRESPAYEIMKNLMKKRAILFYNDPFVPEYKVEDKIFKSMSLTEEFIKKMDITVILVDHSSYDYNWIVKNSKVVFDTRNATKNIENEKVFKL